MRWRWRGWAGEIHRTVLWIWTMVGWEKKLFTHCSHSQAPTWKMHGASVRNTIICMAQRIEAMHATLLDTSTQDAPTVQYSLTQHSLVQQEDSEATRRLEKWTQTCFNKQRQRACVSVGLLIYVSVIIAIIIIHTQCSRKLWARACSNLVNLNSA